MVFWGGGEGVAHEEVHEVTVGGEGGARVSLALG